MLTVILKQPWKKIHPGMSEAYYNRQIEEARTMLKQELWVLMDGI